MLEKKNEYIEGSISPIQLAQITLPYQETKKNQTPTRILYPLIRHPTDGTKKTILYIKVIRHGKSSNPSRDKFLQKNIPPI